MNHSTVHDSGHDAVVQVIHFQSDALEDKHTGAVTPLLQPHQLSYSALATYCAERLRKMLALLFSFTSLQFLLYFTMRMSNTVLTLPLYSCSC